MKKTGQRKSKRKLDERDGNGNISSQNAAHGPNASANANASSASISSSLASALINGSCTSAAGTDNADDGNGQNCRQMAKIIAALEV
jgi:hypothetical protein